MLGQEPGKAGDRQSGSLNDQQIRLTRVLLVGLLATTLLVVALSLVLVGPRGLSLQGLASLFAVAAVIAVALVQLRKGKLQPAIALSAGSLLLLLSYEVVEGGVQASSGILLGFTIPITLAGLLLSRVALIVIAAISALVLVGIRIAERSGAPWIGFDADPVNPDIEVIVFALVVALLAFILDRFGGTLRYAYGEALWRERELTELNAVLRRQIDERERAEEARDVSEGSLKLASEIVGGLGTWSSDLRSRSTTWSDSLRHLLGVPSDSPASVEAFMKLIHPDDLPVAEKRMDSLDSLGNIQVDEFRVVRPDGQVCWVESRYRILRGKSGRAERLIGVIYDVSRHKSVEQELERRVAARTRELTAVNEELEAFTYSASHDLRAPLRALDGFATALVDDYGSRLDSQALHYVDRIRGATRRMSELIDGLLLLSTSTRGGLNVERVNLSRLAESVVEDLRQGRPVRNIKVDIAPDLLANGDKRLLRIMLENLIGNSFKFTANNEKARVEVGEFVKSGESTFYVRDNGVGFDARYADKLFFPFQRLHRQGFEGSGIGLAIVHRVVNRHGGRIWAESKAGNGATFYFKIPSD